MVFAESAKSRTWKRVLSRGPGLGRIEAFGVVYPSRIGRPKGHMSANEEVEEARKMALTILEKAPKLTWEEHKNLRESLMAKFQPLLDLAQIS